MFVAASILAAVAARAETAWVKDELRLNLRSGPTLEYRIKGFVKTGESVTILARREGGCTVRTAEHGDGWVEDGFLSAEPPAAMRLARMESRDRRGPRQVLLAQRAREAARDRRTATLTETDKTQREELEYAHAREHGAARGRALAASGSPARASSPWAC